MLDRHNHPDPDHLKERVKSLVPHYWELEIWEEAHLLGLIRDYFGIEMDAFSGDKLQDGFPGENAKFCTVESSLRFR